MSTKRQQPFTESVVLKDGRTVIVREMNWKAYKALKTRVVDLVASKLSPDTVVDLLAVFKSDDKMATGIQALRAFAGMFLDAIDELTPVLIDGCLIPETGLDIDALPPADVLKLREACVRVTDLDLVLGLEGNALAAVVQRIKARTAAGGGSASNQSSQPDTAGVSLT